MLVVTQVRVRQVGQSFPGATNSTDIDRYCRTVDDGVLREHLGVIVKVLLAKYETLLVRRDTRFGLDN